MKLDRPGGPLRTKICGITNSADAALVVSAGADALGINFFPQSPRYVALEEARAWLEPLRGQIDRVAVVVNPSVGEISAIRASGCFEWIQFHGDESPEFCAAEGGEHWIKAIRARDDEALQDSLNYATDYILVDGWKAGSYGGTGARLNWDVMREFILRTKEKRVLLAGGLTPHNVQDAVRIVRPYGVDVASGVELEAGRKNEYLVREFIRVACSA